MILLPTVDEVAQFDWSDQKQQVVCGTNRIVPGVDGYLLSSSNREASSMFIV